MIREFDERNMAKSRKVCESMAEAASTSKRVLSEREKLILDRWPKFEDGEYVWFGDRVYELCGKVYGVCLDDDAISLRTAYLDHMPLDFGERVKRPAPKVLDADGVEIKVGDAVWHCSGIASGVVTSIDAGSLMNTTRYVDESGNEFRDAARNLTHTRPDSWKRLEEDAVDLDDMPCDFNAKDLIRRAKALAGVEVD